MVALRFTTRMVREIVTLNKLRKPPTYIAKAKAVPLHAMNALLGEEAYFLLILGLGTRWGEWSASRPDRALSLGKDPGTHCTGD
jgi:hypothetical protein